LPIAIGDSVGHGIDRVDPEDRVTACFRSPTGHQLSSGENGTIGLNVSTGRPRTMQTTVFLQAALNGDRIHPAAPRNPTAIAEAARAAVDAGAQSVHVHAFDDAGRETLEGAACAKVLRAIRSLCPESPISLTTSATIVGEPRERFRIVEAWEEMPDLVTANQGEPGIVELCELLLSRGVGIEAGLLSIEDARAFVRSGLAGRCRRVLIEPLDANPHAAVQHAAKMEDLVMSADITLR
jgi:uncharacterized protein (DUF849 family)